MVISARMKAGITVDVERRLVFTHATNPLTHDQVVDHRDRLRDHQGFEPDFDQIISFLDVTEVQVSADEVRRLASEPFFSPSSRRALVASSDELFGLSRMFGAHRELAGGSNIRVFRELRQAAEWIGADITLVEEVFGRLREQSS